MEKNIKLLKFEINNFRGFEHVEIDFSNTNFHVIVGVNGAGKTSILDALAYQLQGLLLFLFEFDSNGSQITKKFKGKSFQMENRLIFREKDIKKDSQEAKNILVANFFEIYFNCYGGIREVNDFYAEFSVLENGDDNEKILKKILENEKISFPIIAYYQSNFVENNKKNKNQEKSAFGIPQLEAYRNLNVFLQNFPLFSQWFKQQEDFENQEKINKQDFNYKNNALEIVRQSIEIFFNQIGNPDFKHLKVQRFANNLADFSTLEKDATLIIQKKDEIFELNALSAGELHLLLLVSDIARRLYIANPSYSPQKAREEGCGVVLIDEIEQHLHPKWQRNIVSALQATFPNIHFIVTTHSPQVVSGAKRESVFILDNFELKNGDFYTENRDANAILQDIFGIEKYKTETKQKIDDFYKFLEKDISKAEAILTELKKEFGNNDLEIIKADLYLEEEKE